MTDFLDKLTCIDIDRLQSIFAPPAANDTRQLQDDRKLVRRTERAVVLDGRRLQNCIEFLGTLPEPQQSFHMVSEKRFSMAHIIPAVLHLAEPATIDYLAVVTLSFSQANITDLLAMLDSGQVKRLDFAYSVYFKSNNKEACQHLADELAARPGCRVYSGLIHAKLLLMQLSDGRALTLEASANLRSCASVEQLCLIHDADLLEFHKSWLTSLFDKAK